MNFDSINESVLGFISQIDSFKMFKNDIERLSQYFSIHHYKDCEQVTTAGEKNIIYLLMRGQVSIISEERTYKNAVKLVQRRRRKREIQLQKAIETNDAETEDKILKQMKETITEFPYDEVSKSEMKIFNVPGSTFGNDKVVSGKSFRPSYALALGGETCVVHIPLRCIEETIKKLANTGENKEKMDFFRQFAWYDNFTQSLKTKVNNCMTKRVFYPGSQIIREGKNEGIAYIIVSGTAKVECKKSADKIQALVYEEDPT